MPSDKGTALRLIGGEDEGLNEVFDAETVDNIMDCLTCVDPPHQVNLGLAFEGECDRCGTYLQRAGRCTRTPDRRAIGEACAAWHQRPLRPPSDRPL